MYMEHDGPPDTKPRGSSGYLPGGVSGEKPAPTAEEIAAAREWLDDVTLDILLADGHERTVGHVRTLLAALDAAEARAKTAERERDEARAALAHRDERLREALDRGNKWEAACHESEARIAELAAKLDGAIVVSDTEETRERIARELWGGEGYSEPWGEAAKNSHPVTYRCVLRDTDAVLAALRESRL